MAERDHGPEQDPHAAALARDLLAGLAALSGGRAAEAAEILARVCDDRALVAARDLLDVRARALSLLGQALVACGKPGQAIGRLEHALSLAHQLGDPEGVAEIEGMREIARAAAGPAPATRAFDAPTATVEVIEASVADPTARAELLVRKANAAIDAGDPQTGELAATRALAHASGVPRLEVLARLCLARALPAEALERLEEAAEIAREAHEPTLLGAIARSAELAGVRLATQVGPDPVRSRG
ncbi:MAG: hypothetical protein ABMA64_21175 [Myxococcota bacterium]